MRIVADDQETEVLQLQNEEKQTKHQWAGEIEKTEDGKFKCPFTDICGYVSKYKSLTRNHTRVHTGEKPFLCDICKKSFAWGKSYKRHMARHNVLEDMYLKRMKLKRRKSFFVTQESDQENEPLYLPWKSDC